MRILTFPHCGRQFECGDTVNIVDIRQAQNAFAFALQYGDLQVNAYTRAWNATDALYLGTFPDGEFITMYDEAVCGFPSRLLFAKSPNAYLQRFPVKSWTATIRRQLRWAFVSWTFQRLQRLRADPQAKGQEAKGFGSS